MLESNPSSDINYKTLIESATDTILLLDRQFRYVYANPAFEKATGLKPENFIGKTNREVGISPDLCKQWEEKLNLVFETGCEATDEFTFPATNGSRILQARLTPVFEDEAASSGTIKYVTVVAQDITSYRQALAQLEAVLRQMPAGIIIAEAPSGKLILGNRQVEEIWRHPFLEASDINEYIEYKGFHRDKKPYKPEEWPLARSINTGEEVRDEEIEIERGDGSRAVLLVSSSPVRNSNGETFAGVVTFNDITERQKTMEWLTRLQSLTEAFSRALTSPEVAEVVLDQGLEATGARGGWLALLKDTSREGDRAGQNLTYLKVTGYADEEVQNLKPVELTAAIPVVETVKTGKAIWIENCYSKETIRRYPELSEIIGASGTKAQATLPLIANNLTLGALTLTFDLPRQFEPAEQEFITAMANQCAQALERSRLYEAEQEARRFNELIAQRILRLQAVTAELSRSLTTEEVCRVIVDQGVAALDAKRGTVLLLNNEETELEIRGYTGYQANDLDTWEKIPINAWMPHIDAFESGKPVLIESQEAYLQKYPELAEFVHTFRLKAVAFLPLMIDNRRLGVIGMSFDKSRQFDASEVDYMLTLARQCAQALERVRLYESEKASRERLAFLAQASAEMASSLDYQTTLQHLAQLAVPRIADWCSIDMANEARTGEELPKKRLLPLAIKLADPAKELLIQKLRNRMMPTLDENNPEMKALLTGEPLLISEVPQSYVATVTEKDPELQKILLELKMKSAMYVPLKVREEVLGVMVLDTAESGRILREADLELAQELARRAAIAIDNARLYREAQQAIADREEFLSIAAHELRTPLTSLKGYVQLMSRQLERGLTIDSTKLAQMLTVINRQSIKLNFLINQLLDVSRLEAGRLQLEHKPVEILPLVESCVQQAQINTDQHLLLLEMPDKPLVATIDALRIEQVITNLIDNAIKYSPDGGQIKLEVNQPDQEHFCVMISDNGMGIPVERRPYIFDRYYQAHEQAHIGGLGLGLYISRQIVEMHGGRLEAEFLEPGTRFIMTLPLKQ
ncbi:MAG TPA: GAF domain-containing protein [Chloroflexia bacterium]|nr:GAF domain-containing protein [Chloroflexia bacterium]